MYNVWSYVYFYASGNEWAQVLHFILEVRGCWQCIDGVRFCILTLEDECVVRVDLCLEQLSFCTDGELYSASLPVLHTQLPQTQTHHAHLYDVLYYLSV